MITVLHNQRPSSQRQSYFINPVAIPVIAFVFSCLALPQASQAEAIPPLTLTRAVELALQNNADLKTLQQRFESAETTVREKKAGYYPTLENSAKGTHLYNDAGSDGTSYDTVTAALSTSVNLFNGFSDQAAVNSSNFSLLAEKNNLSRVQQSTVYQTISTFIGAVTNQELITVSEANLQENRRQLARIEAFYKAGKRPVSDFYQQQAETSQAELTLLSNERDLENSKLEILQIIGLTATDRIQIAAPEIPAIASLPADLSIHKMLANALIARTDLQAQELRIKAAGEEIVRAHAGLLPKISLSAAINSTFNSKGTDDFSSQFNDQGASIGVAITIPLFDRWKTHYEETQAQINRNKEQIAHEKLARQVGVEVEKAIQSLRIATKQVEVAESQVQYAQQALAASEERYNVGVATLVDLSAARKRAVQARYERIKALYDRLLQQVAIAYAQGDTAGMMAMFTSNGADAQYFYTYIQ